jgi:hypothetical protein
VGSSGADGRSDRARAVQRCAADAGDAAGPSERRHGSPENQQQNQQQQQQQQWWPSWPASWPAPRGEASAAAGTRLLAFAAAAGGVMGSGFSVEGPWSVAEALGVLAAIITVHECGHFLAARLQGIHVTEFSIGFGPQLWKRKVCGGGAWFCVHGLVHVSW